MLGDIGRENWPIRDLDESWRTWFARDGHERDDNQGIVRLSGDTIDTVESSTSNGGPVIAVTIPIERPMAAAFSDADGGRHSTGVVNGRTT